MKNKLLFSLSCFAIAAVLLGVSIGMHGQALPGTGQLGLSSGNAVSNPPYLTVGAVNLGPLSLMTPPNGTSLAWLNQNGSTETNVNGALQYSIVPTAAVDHLTCRMATIPGAAGADYTAEIGIAGIGRNFGAGISDGTKIISAYTATGNGLAFQKWDSATSFSGNYYGGTAFYMQGPVLFIRYQQSGATRTMMFSGTGQAGSWQLPNGSSAQSKDDFLTETKAGICVETNTDFTAVPLWLHLKMSNP